MDDRRDHDRPTADIETAHDRSRGRMQSGEGGVETDGEADDDVLAETAEEVTPDGDIAAGETDDAQGDEPEGDGGQADDHQAGDQQGASEGETADGPGAEPAPRKRAAKQAVCAITGKLRPKRDLIRFGAVNPALAGRIRADHPHLDPGDLISRSELARYRTRYVEELLRRERGELTDLERDVARSLAEHETLAENVSAEFDEHRTIGDRLSDQLASFGGSWWFLISFGAVLLVWMAVNLLRGTAAFDPYPFILLNLVLSCLAAIQAPIIMMSQRRQEEKDRLRSENDFRVNLKAELEIRHLHEKVDHLLSRQWERLAEIQQLQLETIQEALRRKRR